MNRKDTVWQSPEVVQNFLEGMRGAIPQATEQIDVMLRLIHATHPNLTNFLDVGCGDGILASAIFSQYPAARGVLLDFSAPMIDAARKKMTEGNTRFLVQDYGAPEWVASLKQDAPFDAIVSGYSIHHQPHERKHELYQEIFDLLKPGGIFINIEHVAPPSVQIEDLFSEIFIDSMMASYERQGIAKSREVVAREYHERPHKEANILAPLELQTGWLREIGYEHVDCYLKIFELAVFGGTRPNE